MDINAIGGRKNDVNSIPPNSSQKIEEFKNEVNSVFEGINKQDSESLAKVDTVTIKALIDRMASFVDSTKSALEKLEVNKLLDKCTAFLAKVNLPAEEKTSVTEETSGPKNMQ